jgi:ubiquinone/menaquinone biosynthesis C-methylase UbiE
MLTQARKALQDHPHVYLERVQIGTGEAALLPYAQESFDLITCTNALHDMPEPVTTLAGLVRLLAPAGQLVVEDFAPREPRFFWAAFEWLLQGIERNRVHAYTLAEARLLYEKAGLPLAKVKEFTIDWFWQGWAVSALKTASEASPATT